MNPKCAYCAGSGVVGSGRRGDPAERCWLCNEGGKVIPFRTTPEQAERLPAIVASMTAAGVPTRFTARLADLAAVDQGVYELMEMWLFYENDRYEIIVDLRKALDDYAV